MATSRSQRALLHVAALCLALVLPVPSAADVDLLAGDRVVFLGDSITASHQYTRMVEVALLLRHPDRPATFVNSGVGGNTAADALARLDRDVLAWRPSVVFVNFGMNDAGDPPDSPAGAFEANVRTLFDRLGAIGGVRRVVWLDPSPFDTEGLKASDPGVRREARIRGLVTFARGEGERRGIPVVRWHDALGGAVERFRAARRKGDRTRELLPDRVHPSASGHAILAVEVLRALGADAGPSEVRGRWTPGRLDLEGSRGRRSVPWDGRSPVGVDLAVAPPPVPLLRYFRPDDPVPGGVADLSRLVLRIEGLPAGRWRVEADGETLARGTSRDLAAGVDLAAGMPREPRSRKALAPDQRRNYGAGLGRIALDDWYALWDRAQAKDRARYLLRADQLALLPGTVPGALDRFVGLMTEWFEDAARGLREAASAASTSPREVRLVPDS